MGSLQDMEGFNLADEAGQHRIDSQTIADSCGSIREDSERTESFVCGLGSHSKVADVDPTENKTLKVGSPPTPIGVKVGSPAAELGKKVATPSNISKTGDFRRPIQVSAGNSEDRQKVAISLYAGAQNPMTTGRFRGGNRVPSEASLNKQLEN